MKASFEEFAFHGYEVASITALVKKTGIPKGSIYHYFESKKDLYSYLVDIAQSRRSEYLQDVLDSDGLKFWDLIAGLFEADFRFTLENPIQALLLNAASLEWNHPDFGNMKRDWIQSQSNPLMYIVEREKGRGKLRDDIPTQTICYLLARLQTGTTDLLEYSFKISLHKPTEDPMFGVSKKEIRALAKDLAKMMKSGLRG